MPKNAVVPKKDQVARWTPLMQALCSSAENRLHDQGRADGWPVDYADALTNENCDGMYAFVVIEMVEAGLEADIPEAIKVDVLQRLTAMQIDLAFIMDAVAKCDVEGLATDNIKYQETESGKPQCPFCHEAMSILDCTRATHDEGCTAEYENGEYKVSALDDGQFGGDVNYIELRCGHCGKTLPQSYQDRLSVVSD